MELSVYFRILARRKWLVIITGTVSVIVAVIVGIMTPPVYSASAVLRAIPSASASSSYAYLNYTDRNLNTLSKIATSIPVLAEARQKLGLPGNRPLDVDVAVIPESELFQVTVKDRDPILAANAANVLATILVEQKTIEDTSLYVADPAVAPGPPSVLTSILYAVVALVIGLGAGVGLAFVRENLDTRIYSTEELKALTGSPILAEIPAARPRDGAAFLVDQRVYYRDVFRRLRTGLQNMPGDSPPRILLLTSSEPEEGKSTVAANLARSLADTGLRIALVDADLRCPTLHTFFDLPNEVGLVQVLREEKLLVDAIQLTRFDQIEVLTSGPETPESSELLASARMAMVIDQLAQDFNMVLLDTPAVEVTSDAAALASWVEGVVLVSRYGWVRRSTLLSAYRQLADTGIVPVGLVVNRVVSAIPSHYRKYYRDPLEDRPGEQAAAGGATQPLKPGSQGKGLKKGTPQAGRDKRKTTASGKTRLPAPGQLQPTQDTKGTL